MNTGIMEEIISSIESILPLLVVKTDDELTSNNVEHVALFKSDGLSELLDTLSDRFEISKEQIVLYLENDKGEVVRIDEGTTLKRGDAIRLRAIVGVIPENCKECKKALSCGIAPEFHCCVRDKTVPGFSSKSPGGPIERPNKFDTAPKSLFKREWITEDYSTAWWLPADWEEDNILKGPNPMRWSPEIWNRITKPKIVQPLF